MIINMKNLRLFSLGLIFLISLTVYVAPAFAHCPLCAAATGAMVSTARVMGVDDSITGLFIGAFIISMALWADKLIVKKFGRKIPLQSYVISVASLVIMLVSFYISGILGGMPEALNLFGMERLFFGILLGSIASLAAFEFHGLLRKENGGKNHIPYQGVMLPVIVLVIISVGFYVVGWV